MKSKYIKTNRAFTPIRKYGWIFTVLVAIGGLWVPKLGLLVLLIMASLMASSFFTGRYWCGNFCPHGSLFDVVLLPISRNGEIPKFLKSKAMIILFFIFFMFNFVRRIMSVAALWGSMEFLDRLGAVFATTYLMVLIVGGLFAVLINPRTWCQFCPMGTMQKISYGIGKGVGVAEKTDRKVTMSDMDKCYKCGKCTKVCPFQLSPYKEISEKNQFDNPDCIKCGVCVENCPANVLSIKTEKEAMRSKGRA